MLRRALALAIAGIAVTGCNGSSSPSPGVIDASHPPAPINNGQQAAPSNLAAAMLQPADLGTTWRAVESPAIGLRTPPPFDVGPAAINELHTNLQTQRWTGSAWEADQTVSEIATNYGSAANARDELALQVAQGRGVYRSTHVGGTTVWQYVSNKAGASVQALFAIGPLYVRMSISPPDTAAGVVPIQTALRLAIGRFHSHPVS